MSTHNIQFHKMRKFPLNICFLELLEKFHSDSKKNKYESSKVNKSSVLSHRGFTVFYLMGSDEKMTWLNTQDDTWHVNELVSSCLVWPLQLAWSFAPFR